jgi:polyphosphate glucokinase
MTAKEMVARVLRETAGWEYSVVSIGYPGPVLHNKPAAEPHNLGPGWVGFDFEKAFGRPIKIVNDAAMQALGAYRGGRMLFLGLGTGLGSAVVADGVLLAMELAHLPYKKDRTYEDYLGNRGLKKRGVKKWRKHVNNVVRQLKNALVAEYVVLGGGNARRVDKLPEATIRGRNADAFRGGFLLWEPWEWTASPHGEGAANAPGPRGAVLPSRRQGRGASRVPSPALPARLPRRTQRREARSLRTGSRARPRFPASRGATQSGRGSPRRPGRHKGNDGGKERPRSTRRGGPARP